MQFYCKNPQLLPTTSSLGSSSTSVFNTKETSIEMIPPIYSWGTAVDIRPRRAGRARGSCRQAACAAVGLQAQPSCLPFSETRRSRGSS
ncbi:hypothetical protein KIN20_015111 [Parelaphostrongylus tenuis]|uniref:Uncharacterized protein n=1 Tax=Parelaphostrongylus tenuis TaxID=148309 RepID=A0AAD5N0A5_PARTN|nr:hypothetical protein KIN20_015111 [Parelaphostrongylus tenuis]